MKTSIKTGALLICLATLCSGCLMALLNVDTPKVELTNLKSILKDIDVFFEQNKALYENADQTIIRFEALPKDFGLTPTEYRELATSIIGGQAFAVPSRFEAHERAKLESISTNMRSLRTTLMNSGQRATETAKFILEKTKALEAELVILRSNYEVVKRNPMASRREKGRTANQIREANSLVKEARAKAESERKILVKLQANGLHSLKKLMVAFKTAGVDTKAAAITAIRDEKNQLTNEAVDKLDASAAEIADDANKTVDGAIDSANKALNDGQKQLSKQGKKLAKTAENNTQKIQQAADAAKETVDQKSKKAKRVLKDRVDELTDVEEEN